MKKEKSDDNLTRRNFIEYTTVLAGGLILSPLISQADLHRGKTGEKLFWYQKPLRIMHTVLRESDAKDYDARAVVDYLKKNGSNTLCVNAGGIVDFFQNPLPAANLNS